MIVPDRSSAPTPSAAPSAGTVALTDWTDGSDPYAAAAPLLDPGGRYAISDSAWALQLLGLQDAAAGHRLRLDDEALPMLRAVKDADELERLAAAGEAADACFEEIAQRALRGPQARPRSPPTSPTCCSRTATRRSTSPSSAPAPTAPTRTTRPATARSRRATWSCSTSAGSRTATAPTPRAPCTSASRPTRSARCYEIVRARPAGRLRGRPARASPARRSTARRAR